MSSDSSVSDALADYLAGKMSAEKVVTVVAAEYYQRRGLGNGDWLRPMIEVIERAHPGIVELSAAADAPGFSVRLAERPFPKRFERQLREAIEGAIATIPHSPVPQVPPTLLARIVQAIRKVFSA
jgi:hypothetical protein